MSPKRQFSEAEAKAIGDAIGIDWNETNLQEFCAGLAVELEHGARDPQTNVTGDDVYLTGKIAWAHLKEIRDYYRRLDQLEAEAEE